MGVTGTWRRWWREHPLVVDTVMAVVLAGLGVASAWVNAEATRELGEAVDPSTLVIALLTVALAAPLAVRRRWPVASFLGVSVVFAVYRLLEVPEAEVSSVVYFVSMASVGVHGAAPWRDRVRLGSLAVMTAVLVRNIVQIEAPPELERLLTWAVGFSVAYNILYFAAAWLLGDAIRWRLEREAALVARTDELLREREENARRAVVEERVRIARELHDVVAHHVSVMGVQAGAARRVLERRPEQAVEALGSIEESSRQAVEEMRRLLGFLRAEGEVDSLAPQPGLGRLHELVDDASAAGLRVELHVEGDPHDVPASVDLSAYRVVQEALTNTRKHARASTALVWVRRLPDALEVEVEDDGRGPGVAATGGHGLVGMRERVALHEGRFSAGPRAGGGFRVQARFPLRVRSAS